MPAPIAALLVPLALLAVACGDDGGGGDQGAATTEDRTTEPTETTAAEHNQADVQFAQMMIPHHRGAISMAELAPDRAQDPFILDIAERIQGAQDPEIQQMTGWLEDWGEEVPTAQEHDMGGGGGGAGAGDDMGGEGMDELAAASGPAFDRLFAELMITHHQGAVDMSADEIANGRFPEAKALAEAIIEGQEAEIAELEGFLARPAP